MPDLQLPSITGLRRAVAAGAVLLVLAGAGVHLAPAKSEAASGDHLRSINAGLAPCNPKGTGIAFDGTNLLAGCWFTGRIDRVSPIDGATGAPITISAPADFGALSFDRFRRKVWACSGGFAVYLIDIGSATAAFQFTSQGCTDGLSHDPTDDTLWSGCQDCDSLYHYTSGGAIIATIAGMKSKLGGYGVGGIAAVGSQLYISNGAGGRIYRCSKDALACTVFAASGGKTDDLECDDVTFAPRTVIWSQHPFQRQFDAWEVDSSCAAQTPPASTATPPPIAPTSTPASQSAAVASTPTSPAPTDTPAPPAPRATLPPGSVAAGVAIARLPDTGAGASSGSDAPWIAALVVLFAAGCLAVSAGADSAARRRQRGTPS